MKMFTLEDWVIPHVKNSRTISTFYSEHPSYKIQLALMENPFPWPDAIKMQWLNEIKNIEINRYPLTDQIDLKEHIRSFCQLPTGFDLLLGNGSNELIQTLLRAFAKEGRCILAPNPSYFLYGLLAEKMQYEVLLADLTKDCELDLSTMLHYIEEKNPVLTFISYPNNPTSNCFNEKDMDTIIKKSQGIVVIDEAYFPYSKKTFLDKIGNFTNVLVLRSFSKVGLAAIRLGCLIGPQSIIDYIDKVQLPFGVNKFSLTTAQFILKHFDILLEQVDAIIKERDQLDFQLKAMGATVLPSDSNYLVFKLENCDSDTIVEYCKQQDILISNLNRVHSQLRNYCRVAIGTPSENSAFMNSIHRLEI